MNREFEGKVAVITGGASGMGLATARLLASRGAAVALLDINDASAQASAIEVEFQARSLALKVDATDSTAVQLAMDQVVAWGGNRLDLAVNAAGIFLQSGRTADVPVDEFHKVMNVNVAGAFFCLQSEIRAFRRLKIRGSIVSITSDAGTCGSAGCSVYTASKHALVGLTKVAALEYGREGIRVNAVAPGDIATPMMEKWSKESGLSVEDMGSKHPIGRIGRAEEVAETICFLLSDRAPFILGANVAVDGGLTASGYYT
ncbi:short chain dehydrogenase/reductase [Thozetella sp. PMI_491]|nr:short chain dehydrogenase/reductase [Thozetella sp. PMI_491]